MKSQQALVNAWISQTHKNTSIQKLQEEEAWKCNQLQKKKHNYGWGVMLTPHPIQVPWS
jgi:hypothetical protein